MVSGIVGGKPLDEDLAKYKQELQDEIIRQFDEKGKPMNNLKVIVKVVGPNQPQPHKDGVVLPAEAQGKPYSFSMYHGTNDGSIRYVITVYSE